MGALLQFLLCLVSAGGAGHDARPVLDGAGLDHRVTADKEKTQRAVGESARPDAHAGVGQGEPADIGCAEGIRLDLLQGVGQGREQVPAGGKGCAADGSGVRAADREGVIAGKADL